MAKKTRDPYESAPDEIINLRLRMPAQLHHDLAREAAQQERSLNSEIVHRLNMTFNADFIAWRADAVLRDRAEREAVKRLRETPKGQGLIDQIVEELRSKERKR